MSKKLIALILSSIITASLVSCSNKDENNVQEDTKPKVQEVQLDGYWAKDYTKEEINKMYDDVVKKIEELPQMWDLDYKKEETVTEESGVTVNDKNIYFDNLNPEPNRMETMYYGFKIYGSDLSSGDIELKASFNLGRDKIKEEEKFDFHNTSLAAFSECFVGLEDRDYSNINSQIYDLVANNKSEGKIEDTVNGLAETITIRDNVLLYQLKTKKFDFKIKK